MDVIKLLPLLIIWAVWRILSRAKKDDKQTGLSGPPKRERGRRSIKKEIFSNSQTSQKEYAFPFPAPPLPTTQGKAGRDAVHPVEMKTFVHEEKKNRLRYGKYSRIFLKNAVIWSEILARPVVLRDKPD